MDSLSCSHEDTSLMSGSSKSGPFLDNVSGKLSPSLLEFGFYG